MQGSGLLNAMPNIDFRNLKLTVKLALMPLPPLTVTMSV
jgi:hypothetical protein